jgi:arylsulfatase A
VGQILTQLDKLQLADNTLVIFTSDDGAALRESKYSIAATEAGFALNGPLRGGKHSEWEGGFRVPFLARWPGKSSRRHGERPGLLFIRYAGDHREPA